MTALPGPFGEAASKLERRFLTTSLAPTVVFLIAMTVVAVVSLGLVNEVVERGEHSVSPNC